MGLPRTRELRIFGENRPGPCIFPDRSVHSVFAFSSGSAIITKLNSAVVREEMRLGQTRTVPHTIDFLSDTLRQRGDTPRREIRALSPASSLISDGASESGNQKRIDICPFIYVLHARNIPDPEFSPGNREEPEYDANGTMCGVGSGDRPRRVWIGGRG
ncbi:hypothetical protein BJX61DRAFT_502727 [Aspergillus egyptiacus]|nr:hypothetical protein BJX61DRAFT_502727 [Aspergillus egyptiacus]